MAAPHDTSRAADPDAPDRLAWLRRLVGSIIAGGALLLAAVTAARLAGVFAEPPERLIFTPLAVAVAFAESVGYVLLPGLIVSVGVERVAKDGESPRTMLSVRERLTELYIGSRIVGLVLMGGATLFLSVAYLMEGRWFVPPLAALTWTGAALQYPSPAAAAAWMAEQKREIERLRDSWL